MVTGISEAERSRDPVAYTPGMVVLAQRPERYLHCPRLVSSAGGGATLLAIAWGADGERVLQIQVGPDGQLGGEQLTPPRDSIVTLTRGDDVAVTDDARAEQEETRAGHRVWVEHEAGVGSVWLSRPSGAQVLVFRARGAVSAPCLAPSADGAWVAFHHDVREDNGQRDVAKWIAVRLVDAQGRVHQPVGMCAERDREGLEQSFEFPALVVGEDGALALLGRGAHDYFRQDLSRGGVSARVGLGDGQWGARGRHLSAVRVRDGIVIARREKQWLVVELLAPAHGGPPALVAARVDWAPASAPMVSCKPRSDPAARRGLFTLFGDLQQHTAHSDGLGCAQEVYERARYRYGDDFVALTDHESFLGKRTSPGEWEYLQQVADQHDAPGAFAALYAYEWTGKVFPGPGHKCVYLPRRGLPIVSRDDVPEGAELVRRVHAQGAFAAPHHIGWTGADEPGHDDEGQPLWEICSCHGCYEHVDHPLGQRGELRDQMADAMLRRGHRFGFCASSDSHGLLWHHGESRKRDPYRTGLTAVQAQATTRRAILHALRIRRCYATSGAKILLDVRANGAPMGTALDHRYSASFEVSAVGTEAIAALELVGAEGVLEQVQPDALSAQLRADVCSPFVYARVRQVDGEMAWSSPVFLGPKHSAS